MFKIILKTLSYLPVVLIIIIAGLTISSSTKYSLPGGYKVFSVQSGSMQPALPTGSLILVQRRNIYSVGDIITFRTADNLKTITHRINKITVITDQKTKEEHGEYTTKGDANDVPDTEIVLKPKIIGKVIFSLPYLGYPISFAKTLQGLIILIVVPATLIIYSEILNIKKEVTLLIAKKRGQKTV